MRTHFLCTSFWRETSSSLTGNAAAVARVVFLTTTGTFADNFLAGFEFPETYVCLVPPGTDPALCGAAAARSVVPELLITEAAERLLAVRAVRSVVV